jgi:macrolide transport system ATP-binding/permease protein
MAKLILDSIDVAFEHNILNGVSYEFDSGKVYLIKGESGIGKSSLLNVLGLLRHPSSGKVFFDNVDLWGLNDTERANFRIKNFGFIFQEHNLIKQLNLEQNVEIPLLKTKLSVKDKHQLVQDNISLLNLHGKEAINSNHLSGGEDQRGAVARALVTDAKVLFADEPTNSLDHDNAILLYERLKSLAHDSDKIVIIVSHEDLPLVYADTVLNIKDKKLIEVSNSKTHPNLENRKEPNSSKKTIVFDKISVQNALNYNKINKNAKKQIPIPILIVIIILLSISSLILTTPKILARQQEKSLNGATDNSIFVTNDTIKSQSGQDLDPMQNFSKKEVFEMKNLPGIESMSRYFTFVSYGLTKDNVRSAIPNGTKIKVDDRTYSIAKTFSIQPIYKKDLTKSYLYDIGKPRKVGNNFVISKNFLAENKIPIHEIIGKTIRLKIYIPYMQYLSTSELPNNNSKTVATDGNIYTTTTISKKITGVYTNNYPYNRSENGNALFMDYATMNEVLNHTISTQDVSEPIFSDFKQQSFGVSAFVIQSKSYNNMTSLSHALQSMSSSYHITSVAQNIDSLNSSVKKTQKSVMNMALVIIIGTIITLSITFFLTNKNRLIEVGILKAIGFTIFDIRRILLVNGLRYGVIMFICSEIVDSISIFFVNRVIPLDLMHIFMASFGTNIFPSFGIVLLASLLPIRNLSQTDPLEIIKKH